MYMNRQIDQKGRAYLKGFSVPKYIIYIKLKMRRLEKYGVGSCPMPSPYLYPIYIYPIYKYACARYCNTSWVYIV